MKTEDLLDHMSKSYLDRIVKSFTTEVYKKDEEGYKNQIRNNVDHLSNPSTISSNISKHLSNSKHPYQDGLLINFILHTLIGSNDYKLEHHEIIENVQTLESEVIKKSKSKENFKHIDDQSYALFKILLETALEDDSISDDELNLIKAVRRKLGMQENDQYMIQAQLNHFPQKQNEIHKLEQINQALTDLQRCGVMFYCNKMDKQPFIIPSEFVDGVKAYLGIELVDEKFEKLLDTLNGTELRGILNKLNLKQTGKKEEQIQRILITGIKPSEVLDSLSNTRLAEICKDLPEVKSSGTKEEKIDRIIKHFDELININIEDAANEGELYYKFFEQLATQDMQNLAGNKVVKHHREAEIAFEKATHYLFEHKLHHQPIAQRGTEHCDGCLKFGNNGELLMWDNKSLINGKKYKFPNDHLRQFKRYIRDSNNNGTRVNCFLIIVPDFEDSARLNTRKLKAESGSDTDVAIISAENLKWIAEQWNEKNGSKPINLELFNMTGLMTKETIKEQMKALQL